MATKRKDGATDTNKKIKRRRVEFKYQDSEVNQVYIAGDFNDWNETSHPLKLSGDGTWKKTMMLPEGSYEYKFVVDGDWRNDPLNEETCINQFGTRNNKVDIP